ncbi:FAD-dependent monooxygenase [Alphaproteobacteria bacterium]|nr:FAD-dependent monooxygenase [Alphaproteobacteria bacterium]
MKEIKTDIVIVGGGLTGLLTACALSSLELRILLIDSGVIFSDLNKKDFRTTAIAEGSKLFFEELGIWKNIYKHSEKIKSIKVFDRNISRKINFSNPESIGNLGYVVKNTKIKNELIKLLKLKKNLRILQETSLEKIETNQNETQIFSGNNKIIAKLLISADGKNSFVREIIGTSTFKKKYNHSAFVTNFSHKKNHNNIAHEIFLESGPLALLPMKSLNKKTYNTSLIWSNPRNFSNNLLKTNPSLRKKILEEKIYNYTGGIIDFFDTKVFDLSAHLNTKFYDKRLVYVGDSAHSLHPIAGQGWNLGVRDVKNLLRIIAKAKINGLDLGTEFVCKNYHNLSHHDAYSLYQVTDKLNSIFLSESSTINFIRKSGFSFINKTIKIKKQITSYAMGV